MAYGSIAAPNLNDDLPVFSFPIPGGAELVTYAVHGEAPENVMRYFHTVFEAELEGLHTLSWIREATADCAQEGRTYPQEGPMDYEAYKAYFFASTTIIGVLLPTPLDTPPASLDEAIGGRPVEEAIGGCNYM
jgi:hypothetical protein